MNTKLTPNQKEILMHRLESGCIEDCFADTEELKVTYEQAESAVALVTLKVKQGNLNPLLLSDVEKLVLEDCLTGSTFFGSCEDAVATKQITRAKLTAWDKAADELEKLVSQTIGHPVHCVRH